LGLSLQLIVASWFSCADVWKQAFQEFADAHLVGPCGLQKSSVDIEQG